MALSFRVCRYEYRYLYPMSDVELAVEFYLSIQFRFSLQIWPHIWLPSFKQRNYMVSLWIRHRVHDPTWVLLYWNDIIMAYLLWLRCWSQISDIEWSISLVLGGGIWSRLYHLVSADTSVQQNVAIIETISEIRNGVFHWYRICQCNWPIYIWYWMIDVSS